METPLDFVPSRTLAFVKIIYFKMISGNSYSLGSSLSKLNFTDHAARLINKSALSAEPFELHLNQSNNDIVNKLNHKWNTQIYFSNDLITVLCFVLRHNKFASEYKVQLIEQLISKEFLDKLVKELNQKESYNEVLLVLDYIAKVDSHLRKRGAIRSVEIYHYSDEIWLQNLVPKNTKEFQTFLSKIDGTYLQSSFIRKILDQKDYSAFILSILCFLVTKLHKTQLFEDLTTLANTFNVLLEKEGRNKMRLERFDGLNIFKSALNSNRVFAEPRTLKTHYNFIDTYNRHYSEVKQIINNKFSSLRDNIAIDEKIYHRTNAKYVSAVINERINTNDLAFSYKLIRSLASFRSLDLKSEFLNELAELLESGSFMHHPKMHLSILKVIFLI